MYEEEIIGAGRDGLVDPSDPRLRQIIEERSRAGKARGELNYRRKDGTVFPVEVSSQGSIIGGQRVLVSVIRDITERKRSEQELGEAKNQAELYVDLMGHDINNMNQSAMGFLELALGLLETEKQIKPEDKSLIEMPLKALESSSKLIDNVRKLQQLMKGGVKTKPVDLCAMLKEIDEEL